jgi:protease-4
MDTGLHGRSTSRAMRRLAGRSDVAAVVLRADSPGGDPLPSELVAEAAGKIREAEKPVVVSQGDMAASGGYLIGTESDEILTTPLTITGSIGVISGWVWDDGLSDRAGLTVDGVQRGAHADLLAGVRYPLLGLRLPDRALNDDERSMARQRIHVLYESFVDRVAEVRGLEPARVREVAQGRVWMGEDAVARELCDGTGTLLDAIDAARDRAGIDPDEEVILEEVPGRRLFRLPRLVPPLPGLRAILGRSLPGEGDGGEAGAVLEPAEDWAWGYLRALAERPGEPMLLTPPDALPDDWRERGD